MFPWLFPQESQQLNRIEESLNNLTEMIGTLMATWAEAVQAWTDYATELKQQRDDAVAALTDAQTRAADAASQLQQFQDDDAATDAQQLADQAQAFADELAAALDAVKNPPTQPDPLPEAPPTEEPPAEEAPTDG